MAQGQGGAAAYSNLRRVDNPVADSMKYWGGIMAQRNEGLRKDNVQMKEKMIKEHQEWAKTNGLTQDMFKTMITPNADFNKQALMFANQGKEKYNQAYKQADELRRQGKFKEAAEQEYQMKSLLSGFNQIPQIEALMKEKGEEFKKVVSDTDNYDEVLNSSVEDMFVSYFDTKNAVLTWDPKTNTPAMAYPSRDGGVNLVPASSILTGGAFKYIPNVKVAEDLKAIVSDFEKNEKASMNGLNEVKQNLWDNQKQEQTETLLLNKYSNEQFKNLYRKYVNSDYRLKDGDLTDDQKKETVKIIAKNAGLYYEQKDENLLNAQAVSMRNTDANNATSVKTTAMREAGATSRNNANIAQKDRALDRTHPEDEGLTPIFSTIEITKGEEKKRGLSIGLPTAMTIPVGNGKVAEVTEIRVTKPNKSGVIVYEFLNPETKRYETIKNIGDIHNNTGSMDKAEFQNSIINALK